MVKFEAFDGLAPKKLKIVVKHVIIGYVCMFI